jgi:putative lipoprotein
MSKYPHLPLLLGMTTLLTVIVLAAFDANAGDQEGTSMKTIEGSVLYRERMLLPEDAEVRVSLEDVARADALADIIATTTFRPKGAPPFAFSLEFDPLRLRDQGRYALRARIEAAGRLLFTSTEHIPAFKDGHEPVKIMVSRVGDTRAGKVIWHPCQTPASPIPTGSSAKWRAGPPQWRAAGTAPGP